MVGWYGYQTLHGTFPRDPLEVNSGICIMHQIIHVLTPQKSNHWRLVGTCIKSYTYPRDTHRRWACITVKSQCWSPRCRILGSSAWHRRWHIKASRWWWVTHFCRSSKDTNKTSLLDQVQWPPGRGRNWKSNFLVGMSGSLV